MVPQGPTHRPALSPLHPTTQHVGNPGPSLSSTQSWGHNLVKSPRMGPRPAWGIHTVGPRWWCWPSRTPRSGAGSVAAAGSQVSTIPALLHRGIASPLPTWQGFASQPGRELSRDGRGRGENRQGATCRASLPASPGPASSWGGGSVEWDRTGSNSSARKKHPLMKLKSRLSGLIRWLEQPSPCEQHLGKAWDFPADHPDSFQCEMRHCYCTSQHGL